MMQHGNPESEPISCVTIKQISQIYDISRCTISRWISKKILPAERDARGHVHLSLDEVAPIMAERHVHLHPHFLHLLAKKARLAQLERLEAQLDELERLTTRLKTTVSDASLPPS